MSEQTQHEDTEAGSYDDLQSEVDGNFGGSWEAFLKAVANPAEILYFVLWNHCNGKAPEVEAWAKDKAIPPDWLPRFYGMLTQEGKFRPDAVTQPPPRPPTEPEPSDG